MNSDLTPPETRRWPGVSIAIHECGGKYVYDAEAAQKAIDFFPTFLRHTASEYAGQPFALEDWQRTVVVAPLFGWKHVEAGCPFHQPRNY